MLKSIRGLVMTKNEILNELSKNNNQVIISNIQKDVIYG